ncbi:phosphotransferase, partial [Streptomyces sp. NPDC059371]|uniref:phosphotransferase n=1 Tax=Streptomyces sp. NPDC059371 TaxID=3346812 RepID=UPI0036C9C9AC
MHADETRIGGSLVRRLLAGQFPRWARLPLKRVRSAGTVNALYRLGDDMAVRLPRVAGGADDAVKEHAWLRRLAPMLPFPVPEILGLGTPTADYPWHWSVLRWLDGDTPAPGALTAPRELAADLGAFVTALRGIDLPGGPGAYRGTPLTAVDAETRSAIDDLRRRVVPRGAPAGGGVGAGAPAGAGPPPRGHQVR